MARVDLRVPIGEKDAARQLGARWDPARKLWYIPEGVEVEPFSRWLPELFEPNIRGPCYAIATGRRRCWRCNTLTRVYAIMLAAGHELWIVEDDPTNDRWQTGVGPTLLSYVYELHETVAARLRRLAPRYRIDYSHTSRSFYWMNHCEHCETKLGDFETIQETDSPFYGADTSSAWLEVQTIVEPFAARCASYTCDTP